MAPRRGQRTMRKAKRMLTKGEKRIKKVVDRIRKVDRVREVVRGLRVSSRRKGRVPPAWNAHLNKCCEMRQKNPNVLH